MTITTTNTGTWRHAAPATAGTALGTAGAMAVLGTAPAVLLPAVANAAAVRGGQVFAAAGLPVTSVRTVDKTMAMTATSTHKYIANPGPPPRGRLR